MPKLKRIDYQYFVVIGDAKLFVFENLIFKMKKLLK